MHGAHILFADQLRACFNRTYVIEAGVVFIRGGRRFRAAIMSPMRQLYKIFRSVAREWLNNFCRKEKKRTSRRQYTQGLAGYLVSLSIYSHWQQKCVQNRHTISEREDQTNGRLEKKKKAKASEPSFCHRRRGKTFKLAKDNRQIHLRQVIDNQITTTFPRNT